MKPTQIVSLILAILLASLGVFLHLSWMPQSFLVYFVLAIAVLTAATRFFPAFLKSWIPDHIGQELSTIAANVGAGVAAIAAVLTTVPSLPHWIVPALTTIVAVVGAVAAATLPASKPTGVLINGTTNAVITPPAGGAARPMARRRLPPSGVAPTAPPSPHSTSPAALGPLDTCISAASRTGPARPPAEATWPPPVR